MKAMKAAKKRIRAHSEPWRAENSSCLVDYVHLSREVCSESISNGVERKFVLSMTVQSGE